MTIATTDGGGWLAYWPIVALALQMVFNVVLTFGMWWLNRKTDRIDHLESRATKTAEQLVDTKMAGVAQQLEGIINVLKERIDWMRDRLKAGDGSFEELNKRDRELDHKWAVRFESFKDYVHVTFATREEIKAMHKRIDAIKQQGIPS